MNYITINKCSCQFFKKMLSNFIMGAIIVKNDFRNIQGGATKDGKM